jgi:dCTP deaminase
LGNDFIVTRRGNLATLDPAKEDALEHRYQTKHFVNFRECFYLHPNELVLAGTLEHFRLPVDVAATVTSRSQWGRAGLVIATATAVHPGFCGTLTLELLNLGEVPLVLYPGTSVAQIVLYQCVGGVPYEGDMAHKPGAHFGGLAKDSKMTDKLFWLPPQTKDKA